MCVSLVRADGCYLEREREREREKEVGHLFLPALTAVVVEGHRNSEYTQSNTIAHIMITLLMVLYGIPYLFCGLVHTESGLPILVSFNNTLNPVLDPLAAADLPRFLLLNPFACRSHPAALTPPPAACAAANRGQWPRRERERAAVAARRGPPGPGTAPPPTSPCTRRGRSPAPASP